MAIFLVRDQTLQLEGFRVVQLLRFRGGAGVAVGMVRTGAAQSGVAVGGFGLVNEIVVAGARGLGGFGPGVDGVDVEEDVDN